MSPVVLLPSDQQFSSPLDISPMLGWYDMSDLSTLYEDVGFTDPAEGTADEAIRGWQDKSGNNYHLTATQNNGLYKPTGGPSGNPAMGWSADCEFDSPSPPGPPAEPFTFVWVTEYDPAFSGTKVMFDTATDVFLSGERIACYGVSTGNVVRSVVVGTDTFTYQFDSPEPTPQAWVVFTLVVDGANSVLYEDNVQIGTGNLGGTAELQDWRINGRTGSPSPSAQHANFPLSEFIIYNKALSAGERAALYGYLQTKWGV